MPIYEYHCNDCSRRSSLFIRSIGTALVPTCTHCGSGDVARLMSTFSRSRSVQDVHNSGGSSAPHDDPRNIGRNVESHFAKQGMALPGELRERIDSARDGQSPKSLPD
jgi:putative FmdB family regulatory protein